MSAHHVRVGGSAAFGSRDISTTGTLTSGTQTRTGGLIVAPTAIKTGAYQMLSTDEVIPVDLTASGFAVTLLANPTLGRRVRLVDAKSNCGLPYRLTISGGATGINARGTSWVIARPGFDIELTYTGTVWSCADDNLFYVPSIADFTADGACTLTDTRGGINLAHASNGSVNSIYGMYKAAPGAAYTLDVHLVPNGDDPANGIWYQGIYVSDGTGYEVFGYKHNGTAVSLRLAVADFTDATTISATPLSFDQTITGDIWLRLTDDFSGSATARTFSVSKTGYNFTTVHSSLRTAFLTPTRIGFFGNGFSSAVNGTFDSWRVT